MLYLKWVNRTPVNIIRVMGGNPGLVLLGDSHVPKVVGSNPCAVYWMDKTFYSNICCPNSNVGLKRLK